MSLLLLAAPALRPPLNLLHSGLRLMRDVDLALRSGRSLDDLRQERRDSEKEFKEGMVVCRSALQDLDAFEQARGRLDRLEAKNRRDLALQAVDTIRKNFVAHGDDVHPRPSDPSEEASA